MYIRWKSKKHPPQKKAVPLCPHVGVPLVSITPVLVHSVRDPKTKKPRQVILWRPGGAFRVCCLDNPFARAAWWEDVLLRFSVVQESTDAGLARWILSSKKELISRLGLVISPPTNEEKKFYRVFKKNGGRVELATPEVTTDFSLLGLIWPFTHEELKRAWRQIALVHHPDRGGSPTEFIRAKEVYEAACMQLEQVTGA